MTYQLPDDIEEYIIALGNSFGIVTEMQLRYFLQAEYERGLESK